MYQIILIENGKRSVMLRGVTEQVATERAAKYRPALSQKIKVEPMENKQ
jgi:hypothetical protein